MQTKVTHLDGKNLDNIEIIPEEFLTKNISKGILKKKLYEEFMDLSDEVKSLYGKSIKFIFYPNQLVPFGGFTVHTEATKYLIDRLLELEFDFVLFLKVNWTEEFLEEGGKKDTIDRINEYLLKSKTKEQLEALEKAEEKKLLQKYDLCEGEGMCLGERRVKTRFYPD